jgi:hypothetical protein
MNGAQGVCSVPGSKYQEISSGREVSSWSFLFDIVGTWIMKRYITKLDLMGCVEDVKRTFLMIELMMLKGKTNAYVHQCTVCLSHVCHMI